EAAVGETHLGDVEGVLAHGLELLQPVAQLAGLAPVAALADAADVDRAVGPDDRAVDAGLEARAVTEDRPLVLALDLLEERALQAAVGVVTEEHLPGERALGELH